MAAVEIETAAATATTAPSRKRRRAAVSPFQWLTLLIIALFVLVPLYTTVLGGFKEIGELRVNPFGFPPAGTRFGSPRYSAARSTSPRWAIHCSSRWEP